MGNRCSRRDLLLGMGASLLVGGMEQGCSPVMTLTDGETHFDCLTPQVTAADLARLEDSVIRPRATISNADAWQRRDSLDPNSSHIVLGVYFLNGTATQRSLVRRYAPYWSRPGGAKVRFWFDAPRDRAQIRVRFDRKLNDSEIGRQALLKRYPLETMNLWSVQRDDLLARRVTLHEFGHALGLRHEHQHPRGGIPWDKPAVYRYYAQNYGWSASKVDYNIFRTYSQSYLCAGFPQQDFRSVMMYDIRPELTRGQLSVVAASNISATDSGCINRIYASR